MITNRSKSVMFAWQLLVIIWLSFISLAAVAQAQQTEISWPAPRRIPGYGDDSFTPVMVVDHDRTVHAFSSQWAGEQLVIMYNQWKLESDWTAPVDILLPPAGQARMLDAFLDESGIMHIVFYAGNERDADIYYSYAPAVDAANAASWSGPLSIGQRAAAPAEGVLMGTDEGFMAAIYAGELFGRGVYATYSYDGGQSWTAAEPIFLTYTTGLFPSPLIGYEDSQKQFHVMWGLPDGSGNSTALYYARMDVATQQWSEAFEFAPAIGWEADTPAIIEYQNELFVIYHNDFPTTRWLQRSTDGGNTWTDPLRLFEHVGTNGPASLVIDGNGTLHMFFGNRVGNPPRNNMWHTVWSDGFWREPVGVMVRDTPAWRDPSYANAVVSQGDTILLTWRTDAGSGPNGVWYTYTQLNAPTLPRQPLPKPTPIAITNPLPLGEPILAGNTVSETDAIAEFDSYEPAQTNFAQLLLVSALPAVLLVIFVLGIRGFRIRNRE